jgi:hypothetical protein
VATYVLTPNAPDPLTGLTNPVLGWQFSGETALDAFEGCNIVFQAGWVASLGPLASSPLGQAPIWELTFISTVPVPAGGTIEVPVVANDTDYFAFDGRNVWTIPLADIQANYTVTPQS